MAQRHFTFGNSLLFGWVRLHFSEGSQTTTDFRVPLLDWKLSVARPGIYFASLFSFGFGLGCYYLTKNILLPCAQRVTRYLKSWTNGGRFLKSESDQDEHGRSQRYSAVIYGASTKVGRCYAHFLLAKGFNLILVERDRS